MYKIVITPDASLLEKASPVEKFDKKLREIISEMQKTLDATVDPVGVGLAAPQVGISKRIFLAKPDAHGQTLVFINPEVFEVSKIAAVPSFANSKKVEKKKPKKSQGKLLEGCLSIPNIWGNVARKDTIKVVWQDENGKKNKQTFTGFPAIIIQHELDHLNGLLFTKHVLEQKEQLYRSYKNKAGEDEFEEIEI